MLYTSGALAGRARCSGTVCVDEVVVVVVVVWVTVVVLLPVPSVTPTLMFRPTPLTPTPMLTFSPIPPSWVVVVTVVCCTTPGAMIWVVWSAGSSSTSTKWSGVGGGGVAFAAVPRSASPVGRSTRSPFLLVVIITVYSLPRGK